MTEKEISIDIINEAILKIKPETVEELISHLENVHNIPREKSIRHIISLENRGELILHSPMQRVPSNMLDYVRSDHAIWLRIIIIILSTVMVLVFTVTENSHPSLIFLRYVLGGATVILVPGFALIKVVFPTKEIENVERLILSIGSSLALVPLVGLLLNYSPWGIQFISITFSITLLTLLLTILGAYRDKQSLM